MNTLPSSLSNLIKDQALDSGGGAMRLLETTVDSRSTATDRIFIAYQGVHTDSHTFIADVMRRGVGGVIFQDPKFTPKKDSVPWLRVKDPRIVWAYFAAAWFDFPQDNLQIVGITGTNGKTSACHYIAALMRGAGKKVGQIGTLGLSIDGVTYQETPHTSPDPPVFYRFLRELVDQGITYLVLEASSQGLLHGKFAGVKFATCLYTSFSQDHLDLHQNMEAYWDAKQALAMQTGGPVFKCASIENTIENEVTYGFSKKSMHTVTLFEKNAQGSKVSFANFQNIALQELTNYGVENIVGACLLVQALGITLTHETIEKLGPPRGRMEKIITHGKPTVIIDYAHTPDALQQATENLNEIKPAKLWVVFGCGGDRDKSKRPLMANAAKSSDHMIITSDNPRTEDPAKIIADITKHLDTKSYNSIENREQAIAFAINNAHARDLILIAGKGHESYQIIGQEKRHFSDRETALKHLNE